MKRLSELNVESGTSVPTNYRTNILCFAIAALAKLKVISRDKKPEKIGNYGNYAQRNVTQKNYKKIYFLRVGKFQIERASFLPVK